MPAAHGVGRTLEARGTLTRLAGLVLEASGLRMPVGSQCLVAMQAQEPVLAEVVGFAGRTFLMPAGDIHGLSSGCGVTPAPSFVPVPPGDGLAILPRPGAAPADGRWAARAGGRRARRADRRCRARCAGVARAPDGGP